MKTILLPIEENKKKCIGDFKTIEMQNSILTYNKVSSKEKFSVNDILFDDLNKNKNTSALIPKSERFFNSDC